MGRFGISGIWKSPATTIPGVLAGIFGVAVALGWCDADTAARYASAAGGVLVAIVAALYKGAPPA